MMKTETGSGMRTKTVTDMRLKGFIFLFFLCVVPGANAQDRPFLRTGLDGYVSNMQSVIFEDVKGEWIDDNLIHNRLNFRLYAGSAITIGLEMRNRFFTGDMVRMDPAYAGRLAGDRGLIDMTTNVFNENSFILNSSLDRAWVDISMGNMELRAGRQRINWGQTFVWNPNDIFNAYSYFDVDYPERPGSDALRLQVFPDFSSTIELAAAMDSDKDLTMAAMYRFNKWGYDIQLLAGSVDSKDVVFGTGWSGSIGSTSFRGELSWFQPRDNFRDTTGTGLFTVGFDRSFSGRGMIQLQAMYCNEPLEFSSPAAFYSADLSAKDLAFSELSLFGSVSYPVSPLVNISMSAIWYPGLQGFFAGPTADISLSSNLDFSFIWQHFNAELNNERQKMNLGFLRMKYSF